MEDREGKQNEMKGPRTLGCYRWILRWAILNEDLLVAMKGNAFPSGVNCELVEHQVTEGCGCR